MFTMYRKTLIAGLTAFSLTVPFAAMANHVRLVSNDGAVELSGELIGFEDGKYLLSAGDGIYKIPAENVQCIGDACPVVGFGDVEFQPVGGSATQLNDEAFAAFIEGELGVAEHATAAAAIETVSLSGSDSLGQNLMPVLMDGYAAQVGGEFTNMAPSYLLNSEHGGGVEFIVNSGLSSEAFAGLLNESTDIGMSTRRIRPDEARQLANSGAGDMNAADQEQVIGVGALVMIAHPDINVEIIGAKQISKIYAGQITNWRQVGGPDLPIVRFDRQADSGPGALFNNQMYVNLGSTRGEGIQQMESNQAMIAAVNSTPGALGFVEFAAAENVNSLAFKSKCGIVFRPNAFAIKAEEYPFLTRLYLYNRRDHVSDAAQSFLDFAVSSDADEFVSEAGFIGLGILRTSQNAVNGRLGTLMQAELASNERALSGELALDLLNYDRLSSTFRFGSGSSQLDNKALADMDRLINYLAAQDGNIEVVLAGFADTDGGFAMNQRLSASRARTVMSALTRAGAGRLGDNISVATRGYSELSPAVCNLSPKAKGINRRVEVWLRAVN